MVLIIMILFMAVTMYLLSQFFPRVFQDAPFWKRFLLLSSKKVLDYYCNTNTTKLVLLGLRINAVAFATIAIGYPSITSEITSRYFWITLQWSELDPWVFIGYIGINSVIILYYLNTQKYGGGDLREDQKRIIYQNSNILKSCKDTNQTVNSLKGELSRFPDSIQPILLENYKTVKYDIHNCQFDIALNHIKTIREISESYGPPTNYLLSILSFGEGCCFKYKEHRKSIQKFKEAFSLRIDFTPSQDIIEGYIFALCAENNLQMAKDESETKLSIHSPWRYIPSFILSSNKEEFYNNFQIKDDQLKIQILGQSFILSQVLNIPINLNNYHLKPDPTISLNFEMFPIWVLYLSYSISCFLNNLRLAYNSSIYPTMESELLFQLTSSFIEKDKHRLFFDYLPDLELYHAISGYLHDQNIIWIDKMAKELDRCQNREIGILFYTWALFNIERKSEAIELLTSFVPKSINIYWSLISMLILQRDFNKIEDILNCIVEDNMFEINENIATIILDLVKIEPKRFSSLAIKFTLNNSSLNNIYVGFIKLFNNDLSDIDFLLDYEDNRAGIFIKYYPYIYEYKGDFQRALVKIKTLLPEEGINEYTFAYVELLEKAKLDPELMEFLGRIRKNGFYHIPFLNIEFNLRKNVHDHKSLVEISDILIALIPDNPQIIYNRLIAYFLANIPLPNMDETIESLNKSNLNSDLVKNIVSVLINIKKTQQALDFIYNQIKKNDNQDLRDFFFQIHLEPEIMSLIDEDKDITEVGDYIYYSEDKFQKWSYIRKNDQLTQFIGKKIGYSFSLNKGVKIVNYSLINIKPKYYGLLMEIIEDIHNNKSKTILSFNYDDIKNNPLEGLNKFIEAFRGITNEEYNSKLNQQIESYQKGETFISLAKVVSDKLCQGLLLS